MNVSGNEEPEIIRFTKDNEPVVKWGGREVIDENRGKSPCGMYGWSITAGELKRALADVPDDYEVMLENAEVDDMAISNVNIDRMLPPFKGSPGLVVLGGGQIVSWEYGYERRMEAVYGEKPDPTYIERRWYARLGDSDEVWNE